MQIPPLEEVSVIRYTSTEMDDEIPESAVLENPQLSRLHRMFSASQMLDCLKPLMVLLHWHGLTPFYIGTDASGRKELKESLWGYLNVSGHIVVYGSCYMLTLMNDSETVAGHFMRTGISRFGDFMQILSGFIGVTVIYLSAIIPKQHVQHSFGIVQLMDDQLKSVGVQILYTKVLRHNYWRLTAMIVANTCYTVGCIYVLRSGDEVPSVALHVTFILQHTIVLYAVTLFECFTKVIERRFHMMQQVSKDGMMMMMHGQCNLFKLNDKM